MRINIISLLLIFASVAVSGTTCFAADAHRLAREGGQMDATERDRLEAKVAASPEDIALRTKLLGYYFIRGRQDRDAKPARARHVLWLIENAPESEVLGLPYGQLDKVGESDGYEKAKQAWLATTEENPDNLAVLANASKFFLIYDRETAEKLLLKGQEADEGNASWPAALGQLYSLGLIGLPDGPARTVAAEKAFQQYKLAYERSEPIGKNALLTDLAKTAFEAGLTDEAEKYAREMLADDEAGWNSGNLIHHGNLILGRIALSKDDLEEAKTRLLAAGKTPGSPQLNSFGPNMLLAKQLLERGEKDVVLAYFSLCEKFWQSPQRQLDQWTEDVEADRTPLFGGNLAY